MASAASSGSEVSKVKTPDSAMSAGSLAAGLKKLGESDAALANLIDLLRAYEKQVLAESVGLNVREEVTGPILDAAVGFGREMTKSIQGGLNFNFRYTSKILRDFLMADESMPDHVWEPQTTRALLELAKGARNVVIGGAYIGDQAIMIADRLKGVGVVHCFELSSDNSRLLELNAEQNGLDNVRTNKIGLWSAPNMRLSLSGEDSHATPELASSAASETFPTTSIDAYGEQNSLESIDLIMLDIEGAEFEALRGADRYLSMDADKAPDVIFEVHSYYVDWSEGLANSDIVRHLSARGYHVAAIRDYNSNVAMHGRPVELVELDGMYLEGPPHGFNVIASKRWDTLNGQVFKTCRGVSPKLLFHRDPRFHAPLA